MNFLTKFKELKSSFFKKENIYFLILTTIIIYLDRITKKKIIENFDNNVFYFNDYINIDLIWNSGIGFGLLSTNSSLIYNLVTLSIGSVIVFLIYIFCISEKTDKFIYSIIIGGALGNLSDRIIYKAVPDFIDLHFDNFHWFTFNVADIFITSGILIFILRSFFVKN